MTIETEEAIESKILTKVGPEFDVESIRADFPTLHREVKGHPLVYLDNAATTHKPQCVIERLQKYYTEENANVHRGVHYLSQIATDAFEAARASVQQFINAESSDEIIFTSGTTDAINLVSCSYGRNFISAGDEIIISAMEHHSNIVPWQLLRDQTGIKLRVIPLDDQGQIIFEEYEKMLNERTKLVSIVHVSNSLGTINPVKRMIALAHQNDIPVLVDGAQAVQHMQVDVRDLDCDFFTFSGHKMFGPTGIGVLYGKKNLLAKMPPYRGGGEMIKSVTFEKTLFSEPPTRFEAGTPNIAGAIALASAVNYLSQIGMGDIAQYEHALLTYATAALADMDRLKIIGTADHKTSVISFVIDGIHPHDVGSILDYDGIAIRTGHHCTQPVMQRYGVHGTSRASFAMYNTKAEIDQLVEGIHKVLKVFG